MSTIKLSIIIPVYNVEKYVEKCIRSCENQDIPKEDYEVIVVNDGSPDGSLAIVERLAKEYSNIKVISQENQGLSGARNTGLDAAKGEYIWFVDSDDWIEENCMKGLLSSLVDDVDIVQIKYKLAYEDGSTKETNQKYLPGIHTGIEITELGGLPDPAPFSVLRSKFLKDNNFKFYPGIYHEDSEIKQRMVYTSERIAFYDVPVYYYLQRASGSIMAVTNPKRAFDYINYVCDHLFKFASEIPEEHKVYFYNHISMKYNNALGGMRYVRDKQVRREFLETLNKHKELLIALANSSVRKYRVEALLFRVLPFSLLWIYDKMQYLNFSRDKR